MVWDTVSGWLKNPEEIAATKDDEGDQEVFELAEIQRIEQELEKIKNGRQKLINILMDEDFGVDDVRDKIKELKQKEE